MMQLCGYVLSYIFEKHLVFDFKVQPVILRLCLTDADWLMLNQYFSKKDVLGYMVAFDTVSLTVLYVVVLPCRYIVFITCLCM